ncbi:MAG: hypothetical protein KAT68_17215 [Bacteroidales bacterium]|nr:hypothetical protein [Bacteroidales bacterium]
MNSKKTLRSKLSYIKKQLRKSLLRLSASMHTPQNERNIILELYKYIKKYNVKSANDYYFQSLNSIISLKKYQKLGYFDGLKKIIENKKNDTVFILGSGPSINELSDNDWKHINNHDSWGFNFGFVHDFVPSQFIVQSTSNNELDKLMADLFLSKSNEYKEKRCEFFARGDNVNYFRFHKSQIFKTLIVESFPLQFLSEHFINAGCKIHPDNLINKMYELGCFNVINNKNIPKFRSTVCFLISLALMGGYKKIVLCGIDMNDNGHFFDGVEYLKKFPALDKLIKRNHNIGDKHPHIDLGKYTVTEYIIALNKLAKEKYKAKIMVSSKNSRLYPNIDFYRSK